MPFGDRLEGIRLIEGDCRVEVTKFADATFDGVVSDPPHGIGLADWDVLPERALLAELYRVLKAGGRLVFIADDRTSHRLATGLEDVGFTIEGQCAWIYATGRPRGKAQPRPAFSPIIVARKAGPPLLEIIANDASLPWRDTRDRERARAANSLHKASRRIFDDGLDRDTTYFPDPDGRWPSTVLASDDVFGDRQHIFDIPKVRDSSGHLATKPVDLLAQLLRIYVPPHGLVLDPYCGSASVGRAAVLTGRRAVLIEKDSAFVQMAAKNLAGVCAHAPSPTAAPSALVPLNKEVSPPVTNMSDNENLHGLKSRTKEWPAASGDGPFADSRSSGAFFSHHGFVVVPNLTTSSNREATSPNLGSSFAFRSASALSRDAR